MSKSWIDDAPEPMVLQEHAHLEDPISYRIKRRLLGHPLNRHTLSHQRLKKRYALGILSSDCISSSAYGSEQILLALVPAFGLAAFSMLMPMTAIVLVILLIVTLSYRNVISVYTKVGGAYIVSRDNFGPVVAQVAAVALMLDYIVTLAIQSAAGVAAIASTFPEVGPWKIHITLAIIVLLSYGNLRGVKEAGKAFALPTYLFVGSMAVVFGIGIYRQFSGTLPMLDVNQPGAVPIGESQGLLTFAAIFILLRAFANGGSSLTGLEAISDGVSLFKTPEQVNARRTLVIMSTILGSLVLGVSWFAHKIHAIPYESETPTVISQIAKAILGDGTFGNLFFIVVQAATMLILFAGANTTYSAFPLLVNFVATDGYLPNWLTKRGHRLNFSNGILLLSGSAMILVFVTKASVEHLVAFYALGVFTAFTLSGLGMAKYNYTNRGNWWRGKFIINALSGGISLIVVIIFAIVKFNQGAWVVILITPILVITFLRLRKQYAKEQNVLTVTTQSSRATSISRHDVSVLVDSLDLATIGAIRYARSLNPRHLNAVHFVIDDKRAEIISASWAANAAVSDVPLILIDCPDRRLPNAAVDYAIRSTANQDVELTLLLPRRSYSRFLGRVLHDQTAEAIAAPISQLERVVATIIPFDVERILDTGPRMKVSTVADVPVEEPKKVAPSKLQNTETAPVGHYSENILPISNATWRRRAHVRGQVTAIRTAPSGGAPKVEVEIWDSTGGITLEFLGRREIAGLDVGSTICAEGMVGETEGSLVILNPSYEIVI
ncbi:MAG: amino acid permease [Actinomycetes bacterium]